ELRTAVEKAWAAGGGSSLTLGLRLGNKPALDKALKLIADEKGDRNTRLACLRILGEIDQPKAVPILLGIVKKSPKAEMRTEALTALQRYPDAKIAAEVLSLYPSKLPEAGGVRAAAHNLLASRAVWTLAFLKQVDAGKIKPHAVPLETVRKMQLHSSAEVKKLLAKHWGQVRPSTPREKQQEMLRVAKVVKAGKGDAVAGLKGDEATCAKCHKLFGKGGDGGPDLTGYERDNLMYWIENIVDPSAVIREEYQTFEVQTTDGRSLTGIIAARDKTTVTLKDQEGKTIRLERKRIEQLNASKLSLMPEGQLK